MPITTPSSWRGRGVIDPVARMSEATSGISRAPAPQIASLMRAAASSESKPLASRVIATSACDEAIQTVAVERFWIASRRLSSGRALRGPDGSQ